MQFFRWISSIGLALTLCIGAIGTASAKPIAVTSENFEFYGDTSEKAAIDFVEGLEAYRAILFSLYRVNPGPEFIPVRIYGFKSQGRIEKVTGRDNIGGLYSTTLEGPVFLLTTEGGLKRGKASRRIAFHEYTHHVLAGFTDQVYPRWYNEGFADYLSTFEYNDKTGKFKLGLPNDFRAYSLANESWLPYDVIIGSVRKYPFKDTGGIGNSRVQSLFYAQSWLAAHYIQSTPGHSAKIGEYIKILNRPDAPEDAFGQTMGVTSQQFAAELKKYHRKNQYRYTTAQLADNVEIPTVTARKMSKAELKYHYGEAARLMIQTDKGRALAAEYFDEAAEEFGETPEILMSRALLAYANNELESGSDLARRAYAAAPDNRHVRRTAGILELEAYQKLGAESGSLEAARDHLLAALRAYPDDVTAHYYYALSFGGSYEEPSRQAVASARGALAYYRSLDFLETNVNLAQILERGGEPELAIPVYEKIMVWSQRPMTRTFARSGLKRLKRN